MSKILALVACVVVVAAGFFAFKRIESSPTEVIDPSLPEVTTTAFPDRENTAVLTISDGDTADGIGEVLEEEGVINSARLFRVLVALMGIGDDLGSGEYEFQLDTPILTVIDQLRRGGADTSMNRVTIREGLRLEEVAEVLEENEIVPASDFLAAVEDPGEYDFAFLEDLPRNATLEGYLFPATYEFRQDVEAATVVEAILQAFDDNLTPEILESAEGQGLTLHELMTVASIVEREAVVARERPMIARVYLNRIDNDMRLEADPTTQYAVATDDPESVDEFGWWKQELTVDDLALDSPYNTYASDGIPPGPIAAPGLASIEAVADPVDGNNLFFVACGEDGAHEFAATFADHEANVARCQG